ncbi:hypothetical protein G7Y79_00048g083870 [Physcia stellaris]|nr:hypothetical protein G7Y79_00048g083870 [Physcia stellaris]
MAICNDDVAKDYSGPLETLLAESTLTKQSPWEQSLEEKCLAEAVDNREPGPLRGVAQVEGMSKMKSRLEMEDMVKPGRVIVTLEADGAVQHVKVVGAVAAAEGRHCSWNLQKIDRLKLKSAKKQPTGTELCDRCHSRICSRQVERRLAAESLGSVYFLPSAVIASPSPRRLQEGEKSVLLGLWGKERLTLLAGGIWI